MVAYLSSSSGAADSRACDRKSAGSHYTKPSKHAAATLADNVFTCATAMLEGEARARVCVCLCASVCVCTDTQTQIEKPEVKFMWKNINV